MLLAVKIPPAQATAQSGSGFIPAFDFLRASMMLLGVALHSAFNYSRLVDRQWQWYFQDATAAAIPTAGVLFIHLFRMPVFFVMAGFFAAQLWSRGKTVFFKNRLRRVIIPFVVGWPILFALIFVAAIFANFHQRQGFLWGHQRTFFSLLTRENWPPCKLTHLWFLYYLIIYYIIAEFSSFLRRLIPTQVNVSKLIETAVKPATLRLFWIQFILVTLILTASRSTVIYTPGSFIPEWNYLAFFAVFFFSGWITFSERERIAKLNSQWPLTLPLGIFAATGFAGMEMRLLPAPSWLQMLCLAAASCLLVHGIIGAVLKFYTSMNPMVRSLSRASYWIYLTHLPIIYLAAGLMAPVPTHWSVKLISVFAITLVLSFSSYYLWGLIFGRTSTRPPQLTEARPVSKA